MNAVVTGTLGDLRRESGLPRAEAESLLGFLLGKNRAFLIAHDADPVDTCIAIAANRLFERRRAGEPIAYLTGAREFYGLALQVTPEVLIPRHETERLVELALARIPARISAERPVRVLELGTGSGAIAIALAHERLKIEIIAVDISAEALVVASDNARRHGAKIEFCRGNWFDGFDAPGEANSDARFDFIVSNPPYVAENDVHLAQGDVRFEPRLALAGGEDGLECIRKIATQARGHLLPGGWLMFEHGYDQGPDCVGLLRDLGYTSAEDFTDLAGLPRVCAGCWRG